LPVALLLQNIQWFCRLRWLVVASFLIYATAGKIDGILAKYGLIQPGAWPFIFAGVLAVANILYIIHIRSSEKLTQKSVIVNLWVQIVVDISVLTVVVHYVGSLETHISFIYLFHIVLACEFFPRIHSLFVTLLACALFIICVTIEHYEIHPPQTIFTNDVSGIAFPAHPARHCLGSFYGNRNMDNCLVPGKQTLGNGPSA
jgi:two-component system phosphate regulon sensor histidine kinase PhoR